MGVEPQVLIVAPFAVFVAFFVFGMTGFGSSVIAVPLLAHVLPLQQVVPTMVLMEFVASFLLRRGHGGRSNRRELAWLVPVAVVGIGAGAILLARLPAAPLLAGLGTFVLLFGLYTLLDPSFRGVIARAWVLPAGLVGGTFTALFGTGGPVYAIYLSRRIEDRREFRSTMAAMITVSTAVRIVAFALTGLLLHLKVFLGALVLAPVMLAGVKLGSRVHLGISPHRVRQVLGAVLVVSGMSLLAKGVG
ncbi:MAG: sulfite exporter TauE/SafE family protein [Pseudomonadota bacterium]